MPPSPADRDWLFGLLAVRVGFVDAEQFAQACLTCAGREGFPLPDVLVERGVLRAGDRELIDRLAERLLAKHAGDVRIAIAGAGGSQAAATPGMTTPYVPRADAEPATVSPPPGLPNGPRWRGVRVRYQPLRMHAKGGIGQVFLARDESLGREVALKELLPDQAGHPPAVARFLEEARITGQLEHPGIVPVYEFCPHDDGGQPFYTMRFVKGRTLAQAIRSYHANRQAGKAAPLELRELLGQFISVCNAVAYAHARGVLHRDLKPGNIVLGDFGEVIVLDWGLAKARGASDTQAGLPAISAAADGSPGETVWGQVLGTPSYMSPEQAEGRIDAVDEHSDVYGLGAVLYELLTGRPPFTGADIGETLGKVVAEEPLSPRQLASDCPPALAAVCLKALRKRPADRYGSVKALAEEVRHWLGDEPVAAYPEPWQARLRRWVRRHRTAVTAAAAAAFVAAIGLAISTGLLTSAYRQTRDQRDRARAYLGMAQEAVRKYHTDVAESPELKARGLEGLRGDLLAAAATFYDQFTSAEDADPDIAAERGRAYYRLGSVYREMGRLRQAETAYRKGLALFQDFATDRPGERAWQLELARGYAGLGDLFQAEGAYDQAVKAHQQAQQICEPLAQADLAGEEYSFQLGMASLGVAKARLNAYRFADAKQPAVEAVEQLRRLGSSDTASEEYRFQLAEALNAVGKVAAHTGDAPQTESSFREAIALYGALTAASPDNPKFQFRRGDALRGLGQGYLNQGRPADALPLFEDALKVYRKLISDHPIVPDYHFWLGITLNGMAMTAGTSGKLDQAQQALAEANVVFTRLTQDYPANERYKDHLFDCKVGLYLVMVRRGEYAAAVVATEALLKEKPRDPVIWYNAACVYSLSVPLVAKDAKLSAGEREQHSERYARRAVELLRESAARGGNDVEGMRTDSDLDALRAQEAFRKLLQEVEQKAGTKK